jgi:hypothetical protein
VETSGQEILSETGEAGNWGGGKLGRRETAEACEVHEAWSDLRQALYTLIKVSLFLGGLGVLVCLSVLFAVSYQKSKARKLTSVHQLRQIAIAMQNYHAEHGCFPRAYWISPQGERTLSWRVALLPYLEQKPTFEAIDVGEPWDDPVNQEATHYFPSIYRALLSEDDDDGGTGYLLLEGPGTLFQEGRKLSLADCKISPSETMVAIEVVQSGIRWAEPKDIQPRQLLLAIQNEGGSGICLPYSHGVHVAFAGGSVRFLSNRELELKLREMLAPEKALPGKSRTE